jgi:hypothetical protein
MIGMEVMASTTPSLDIAAVLKIVFAGNVIIKPSCW